MNDELISEGNQMEQFKQSSETHLSGRMYHVNHGQDVVAAGTGHRSSRG